MNICFYRRHACHLFDSNMCSIFGGAEVRSRRFAVALASKAEYSVNYVVGDEGYEIRQPGNGLNVIASSAGFKNQMFVAIYQSFSKNARRISSFPWLKIESWDINLVWQIPMLAYNNLIWRRLSLANTFNRPKAIKLYEQLNPDVVCCFGVNAGAADVIASCRRYNIKSILFLINDSEANPENYINHGYSNELGGEYGDRVSYAIKNADHVITQTHAQKQSLSVFRNNSVTVIRNPIDAGKKPIYFENNGSYLLWIGRAEGETVPHKRPELCLELAKRCKTIPFKAIINPVDQARYDRLVKDATDNLEIIPHVSRADMTHYYKNSRFLVSTSAREGFPNSFLEAAKYGKPVVSLKIDPDNIIRDNQIGYVCHDNISEMASTVEHLWRSQDVVNNMGKLARKYIEREHRLDEKVNELISILRDL